MRRVSCQDVVYEGGVCRVEIFATPWPLGGTHYVARFWLVEPDGDLRPLELDEGQLTEIHAET